MKIQDRELAGIIRKLRAFVELQTSSGIEEYLRRRTDGAPPVKTAVGADSPARRLEKLSEKAGKCRECDLHRTRKSPVFGEGNPRAELLFVGEAPGEEEDRQGRPFVGRAGQLLTKIIEAMGLRRQDVYIANCLKCRPPENRNPLPTEIIACRPLLREQLEIIKPKVICCLGKFACHALLDTDEPITRLRGRFQEHHGIKVMPTFHPAYLLRNPDAKRIVWEDIKKIMEALKKDKSPR